MRGRRRKKEEQRERALPTMSERHFPARKTHTTHTNTSIYQKKERKRKRKEKGRRKKKSEREKRNSMKSESECVAVRCKRDLKWTCRSAGCVVHALLPGVCRTRGDGGKTGEKSAESRGRKPGENSANCPRNSRARFPPDLRIRCCRSDVMVKS